MTEVAVYLDDILMVLGWSRAKFFRKKKELMNSGAIFERNEGRPPRKRLCAFPSTLRAWQVQKSMLGEPL